MKNFSKFDGDINIKGYAQHFFIEDDRILSIPTDIDGSVNLDNIVYTDPLNKDWYKGWAVVRTMDLGEELQQTANGPISPILFEGTVAQQNAVNAKLFNEKSFKRFILLVIDRNGNTRICGEPGNGLIFSYKGIPGGYVFQYKANYNKPSWYAFGSYTISEIGDGGTGLFVTVNIKNSVFTVLSTNVIPNGSIVDLPAPDASAVVKNSLGTTQSTNAIPSNVSAPVLAKDAILTLNSVTFLDAPSDVTTDIKLVDEDNVAIVPLSVMANKITVEAGEGDPFWEVAMHLYLTGNGELIQN